MMVTFLVTVLAPFVVLATRVVANPLLFRDSSTPISLPITKQIDSNGKYNPVRSDRRRVEGLNRRDSTLSSDAFYSLPLENTVANYVASIGVGNPPTNYTLIVDTGSANTWVGGFAPYVKTNTSVNTSETVGTVYSPGRFFMGNLVNDTVAVVPGLAASQQPIGVSFNSSGFFTRDGILGLGPKNLTRGTLHPDNTTVIPTVTDTLFAQGKIKQNLVAISFEPTDSPLAVNGEVTFGATDPTKSSDISYFPVTKSFPSSQFWGVDASVRYGSANHSANASASVSITNTTAGIFDTGATLTYLSTDAYKKYVNATGAVFDSSTQFLRISDTQYSNLQSLVFVIGNSTFELTPNAQIWPRTLNHVINGNANSTYLVIQDLGSSFPGVDFLCGMTFLERFYSVFDTENRLVGLAPTPFTSATTN